RNERVNFMLNHNNLVYEKTDPTTGKKYLCVTMYAIWDEYPEIFAKDFTLMSNDAVLTNSDTFKQAVIDNYVTTKDYEQNYKSDETLMVTVENLDYDAIKAIGHGGEDIGTISVTVKVVDEVGNESYDTCDVTIISSTGMTSRVDGENAPLYVRFVDEKNWLKNDFWKIIFNEGKYSLSQVTNPGNSNTPLTNMEFICEAYELWLTQTGVSSDVEKMLDGICSDETINKLKSLDTSETNLERVTKNNVKQGAMEPYSKWYLNPQLVYDINESFEDIVSNFDSSYTLDHTDIL
ncbi:MAG: hypothetical protein K6B41_09475, partial [Butyrivibrio sp.]|nr:hypothetical protein [Butyrivibrio sp.]